MFEVKCQNNKFKEFLKTFDLFYFHHYQIVLFYRTNLYNNYIISRTINYHIIITSFITFDSKSL